MELNPARILHMILYQFRTSVQNCCYTTQTNIHKIMKLTSICILAVSALAVSSCNKQKEAVDDRASDAKQQLNQEKDALKPAAKQATDDVDANAEVQKARIKADMKSNEAQIEADKKKVEAEADAAKAKIDAQNGK
jgi:cell division septum initiation protein DivIVA